jgi:signal transduction histidine kinase/ligand-binding sensor domain-containing protein
MKKSYILTAYILFQLVNWESHAQEIKFNLVEGNNGEALGQINGITQDTRGYMWFSGQGNKCIYRYDGIHMIAFRHDSLNTNSPGQTNPETVYADSRGMIWIGYQHGAIDKYNPSTGIFKHFVHDSTDTSSLGAGLISAILRDHKGRLWVGTASGLDLLDEENGKFIHYRNIPGNPLSLSSNNVRAIYEDSKGTLWIGTGFEFTFTPVADYISPKDGGLNRMEKNGEFTRFLHDPKNPNSLINNKVKAIFEDSRGIFWIGTSGDGLHTMDRARGMFERHPYDPSRPYQLSRPPLKNDDKNDPITSINEDASGAIWIGTYASGLNRYDTGTKKITHYESSNGFPDKTCWTTFESRDKVLWLSSTDQGKFLYRVDPKLNQIPNISTASLPFCVQEDLQGLIWVFCFNLGLQLYDQHKKLIREFKADPTDSINLTSGGISSLFQNQPDSVWFCSNKGIILFNKKSNHFSWLRYKTSTDSKLKKFTGIAVSQIIQDKTGLKWFATNGGLFQYSTETLALKVYQPDAKDTNSISSSVINSVLEDASGNILAASQNGINKLDIPTNRFRHYLNGIAVSKLYQDSEAGIWACTVGHGLYKFNNKEDRFIPFFDPNSELYNESIINVIEDDLNNLWIFTSSTMVKLKKNRTKYFLYGKNYGIRSQSLKIGGICKTSKGEILVLNNNGFYAFYPNDLEENFTTFKINITGLIVNNNPEHTGENDPLLNHLEETNELLLKYNQNIFTIYFAVPDYRAPEANRYFTKLDNYDSTWREAGGDKSAFFVKVPPGKYIFRVKVINIDGVWTEKSMQIIVSPPWWMTWWAYTLYGLMLLTVILGVHRFQKQRTIRIERQKAQVKELAQAKEIEKAYTELKATQAQLIHSEKMASLGEMTAGIAHEIQNPLNFVNNFSEINKELLEEFKSQNVNVKTAEGADITEDSILNDIGNNMEKILHHGHRADAIVKSMLQHTKTSGGQKEPVELNAMADEYLKLAYHGFRAKDKSFTANMTSSFDKSIGTINIIPQDIGRVLLNLYNNAFYAVSEKTKLNISDFQPTVSVYTKRLDHKVEISIKDNGTGIPEKARDKIFQPFFTTKPTGQGTGLGLSLSYDIIKAHQGEIKVESKEGEFTEFTIQLPI